jgi:pyruvate dehydrogenase E1 component alpha subunit
MAHGAEMLELLRRMLLIRRFEEKVGQLYGLGLIGGFCHLCIGQEAVCVGLRAAMHTGDRIVAGHRAHGHALAAGVDPARLMAEMTGRSAGWAGGLGGAVHVFAPEHGFFGGLGLVGAPAPLGAGLAFAGWYGDEDSVAFAIIGDGAADRGEVYEALHLVRVLRLPLVVVIENNHSALGSPRTGAPMPPLWQRGAGLGIEGEPVDGMDVLAVRDAAARARARCQAGQGPVVLDCETWRYRGHAVDGQQHMLQDADRRMRSQRDPVDRLRELVLAGGPTGDAEISRLEADVRAIVATAAGLAQSAPEPMAAVAEAVRT